MQLNSELNYTGKLWHIQHQPKQFHGFNSTSSSFIMRDESRLGGALALPGHLTQLLLLREHGTGRSSSADQTRASLRAPRRCSRVPERKREQARERLPFSNQKK